MKKLLFLVSAIMSVGDASAASAPPNDPIVVYHDCRYPQWDISQCLVYVGAVNTTYMNVEEHK